MQSTPANLHPPRSATSISVSASLGHQPVSSLDHPMSPIPAADSTRIRGANRERIPYEAAASRIIDHAKGLRSQRVPLSGVKVADGRVKTKDSEFRLDDAGFRRLANQLHAPVDYLARLTPRLRDGLLNHHLREMGQSERGLKDASSRIVHRDGLFINLGRTDLHTLGAHEVLNAVRDGFGGDAETFEAMVPDIRDEAFSLDLVSPRISAEVRRGDVIQAGVRIEHAHTGERATTIMAFVMRVVCTNGMIQRECVGSRETTRTRRLNADRGDAAILQTDQVRRLTEEVKKGLGTKLEAIRKLADQRADEAQLAKFLGQARMHSRAIMDQVREAWAVEENERTAFGLFNALTRLATHGTSLSDRQRGMLARLAGIYANRDTHVCPKCFSALNSPSSS